MVVVERGSRTVSRDDGDLPYGLLKTERPVLQREQAFDEVMKYLCRVSNLIEHPEPYGLPSADFDEPTREHPDLRHWRLA